MNRHKYLKPAFVCLVCLFEARKQLDLRPIRGNFEKTDETYSLETAGGVPSEDSLTSSVPSNRYYHRQTKRTLPHVDPLGASSLTVLPAVLARFSFTTRNVFSPAAEAEVCSERAVSEVALERRSRPTSRSTLTCIGDRRRRHRRPRTGRSRERTHAESRGLSAGVTECGGDVIDVGVQPTPTVARSVVRKGRRRRRRHRLTQPRARQRDQALGGRRAGIRRRRKRQNRRDRRGSGVQPRRVGRTRRAPPRRRRTRAPRASAPGVRRDPGRPLGCRRPRQRRGTSHRRRAPRDRL